MKIPLKAFIIIHPESPYPNSSDIKIGGVASSAAKELANQDGGIVVPLTGFYDLNDLIKIVKEQIDDNKQMMKHYKSALKTNKKKDPMIEKISNKYISDLELGLKHYKETLEKLTKYKISDLTNLTHFSENELNSLNKKKDNKK